MWQTIYIDCANMHIRWETKSFWWWANNSECHRIVWSILNIWKSTGTIKIQGISKKDWLPIPKSPEFEEDLEIHLLWYIQWPRRSTKRLETGFSKTDTHVGNRVSKLFVLFITGKLRVETKESWWRAGRESAQVKEWWQKKRLQQQINRKNQIIKWEKVERCHTPPRKWGKFHSIPKPHGGSVQSSWLTFKW